MQTHTDGSASFTSGGIYFRGVRADATQIAGLRQAVRQWLGTLHLEPDHEHDVVLASYEALANAVEHAYSADDEMATVDLEVTFRPQERHLEVTVADHGRWRDMIHDPNASRGHGLALIRKLTTEMVVTPGSDGTHVAMRWAL